MPKKSKPEGEPTAPPKEKKKKGKKGEKTILPPTSTPQKPQMRQIVIVTDGNTFRIMKADVTPLELKAICNDILRSLGQR